MNNNNPNTPGHNNPGIPVACDTPAQQHNPHCNPNTEEPTVPDTNDHIELCNTVVCDEHGNIITEEDNTMENHPHDEEYGMDLCTEEFINAPFCQGPSDQDEVEFTPPPFDCAAGPDPDTQEYIDSNWEQQLKDNGCFDVELGEPQVIEREVEVELGPATVIEREETITEVGTAPELPATGGEFGFGVLGLLAIAAGITVLRRTRKA